MRVYRQPRFAAGPSLVDVIAGGIVGAAQKNLLSGLASIYDTIEIRTAVTPPAVIDLYGIAHDSGGPSPLTKFLRPTIVFSGRAGREVIAPYGEAEGTWAGPLGVLGFLLGLGFVLGRASKR